MLATLFCTSILISQLQYMNCNCQWIKQKTTSHIYSELQARNQTQLPLVTVFKIDLVLITKLAAVLLRRASYWVAFQWTRLTQYEEPKTLFVRTPAVLSRLIGTCTKFSV